jgi:hypothetical protein
MAAGEGTQKVGRISERKAERRTRNDRPEMAVKDTRKRRKSGKKPDQHQYIQPQSGRHQGEPPESGAQDGWSVQSDHVNIFVIWYTKFDGVRIACRAQCVK